MFFFRKKIWISWDALFIAFSEGQKSGNKNRDGVYLAIKTMMDCIIHRKIKLTFDTAHLVLSCILKKAEKGSTQDLICQQKAYLRRFMLNSCILLKKCCIIEKFCNNITNIVMKSIVLLKGVIRLNFFVFFSWDSRLLHFQEAKKVSSKGLST